MVEHGLFFALLVTVGVIGGLPVCPRLGDFSSTAQRTQTHMTASALIALLVSVGFAEPQARAIENYAVSQAGYEVDGEGVVDPCAKSWMGDGLFGLTRELRRSMHAEAGTRGCVSAEDQVRFIAHAWPEHYPNCAAKFAAGNLHLFKKCFGLGEGS